jgi:hypothetical protein
LPIADIVVDTSDGFVDLRIPVIQSRFSEGGEAVLIVGGTLFERAVEITFYIRAGILPNDLWSKDVVINSSADGVQMSLEGERGRNFAIAFSKLYQSHRSSFLMPAKLSFTAVTLDGNPANIANETIKFKLFHEEGSTDEEEGPGYFEMFLNIEAALGFVEFNEKDTDFRSGVLNSIPPELN